VRHDWNMTSAGERAAYWRVPGFALEAMDARCEQYAYPVHAHDTYSFGITDDGAQSSMCGGERHVGAAGLVVAFNPDERHDGQSAVHHGCRYRMPHLGEDLVREGSPAPTAPPRLPTGRRSGKGPDSAPRGSLPRRPERLDPGTGQHHGARGAGAAAGGCWIPLCAYR